MYELNFKHKYGYILRIYEGRSAKMRMLADIEFYKSNFEEGSAEYLYYAKDGETPQRHPVDLRNFKPAAGH